MPVRRVWRIRGVGVREPKRAHPLRRRGGFTLIEALVASTVLLLTSAGVSGVIEAALRSTAVEAVQRRLERRVQAELARLGALPFVVPVAAPGPGGYVRDEARSLAQAVFPHALVSMDTAWQRYVALGSEPATFVTVSSEDWGSLETIATFVRLGDDGWESLTAQELEGWAVWQNVMPPSAALRVTVAATSGGADTHRAEATVVFAADRPLKAEAEP